MVARKHRHQCDFVRTQCRLITFAALAVFTGNAAWERHVIAGQGDKVDRPQAHSLAYFTHSPLLRTEDPSVFWNCTLAQKLEKARQAKADISVQRVGILHGYAIYEVLTKFEAPGGIWKFILVKVGPDRFREIYHVEADPLDDIEHSSIVVVGDQQILRSRDVISGNGVVTLEAYFWFDANGPTWIDLAPIWNAARSAAPKESRISEVDWNNTEELKTRFRVPVQDSTSSICCNGFVHVKFVIKKGRVQVIEAKYDPDAER